MPKPVSIALNSIALIKKLERIKLFLCDVDGVLTDGSIFIGGAQEIKRFNIRDGLGLVLARRAGLK
ncbi:MAG: phosphatase, partial [Verrucomicrobiota bacterium]